MRRQLNFFASPADAAALHGCLLDRIAGLTAVATDEQATPRPVAAGTLGSATVYLVAPWAGSKLVYHSSGAAAPIIDPFGSPVLEYDPSVLDAGADCIRAGRIYWGYRGQLGRPEKRAILDVFRWVENHSDEVPGWGGWRMFGGAKQIPFVRQTVTGPRPNPQFVVRPSEG